MVNKRKGKLIFGWYMAVLIDVKKSKTMNKNLQSKAVFSLLVHPNNVSLVPFCLWLKKQGRVHRERQAVQPRIYFLKLLAHI